MTSINDRVPEVSSLNTGELLALFKTLESPTLGEMNGEYSASLLKQPSLLASLVGVLALQNPIAPGKWLCKSFRPVDHKYGRGYNTFMLFGRVVQRFPMLALIAPSRYDGRPAYQLVYRAYRSFCGDIHMVDEIRRLGADAYLGIGTWGYSAAQRQVALPFLLTGPVAPYRGDIGVERSSWVLAKEIPALAGAVQQVVPRDAKR